LEQLPILEQLSSAHQISLALESLAVLYRERRQPGDRERADGLLRRALEFAAQLHPSVADRIRARLSD
jgi:hypothetical protein